jgi:iron complex outermembrane recepter protein
MELSQKLKYQNYKLESNYTYQKAINNSEVAYLNGKYLPLRPLHEWHNALSYNFHSFEIGLDTIFIGAVFKDRANEYQNYQASRYLHSIFFSHYFLKSEDQSLSINFEVRNIFDKRAEDIVGYPLPGRIYYATLNGKF